MFTLPNGDLVLTPEECSDIITITKESGTFEDLVREAPQIAERLSRAARSQA